MAKKWIQSAIKRPGALRKTLGVSKKTGNITAKNLKKAVNQRTKAGLLTKTARRARLAMTLRSFKKK